MSAEIVLNGAKMWEGTTVVHEDELDQIVLFYPGDGVRIVGPGDELILDGNVITGPHAGMKFETRQVGPSLLRDAYYTGKHGEKCEETVDGWVCRHPCTVVDERSVPVHHATLDALVEVVPEIVRKRFRVHWTLSRHSHRYHFTNGRAHLPADEDISRAIWFLGQTWTKWGTRRQIARRLEEERDRLV